MNEDSILDMLNQMTKMKKEMDSSNIKGDEFGLFDYNNESSDVQEHRWMVIAYMIDAGRIKSEDAGMMFRNNPFFYDWYKRTILADTPVTETYH